MEKKNYNFLIFFLLVIISVVKHFIRSGFAVCMCQKSIIWKALFFLFILTLFLLSQDWLSINQIQQEYFLKLEWAFCFLTFPILPPEVFRRQQDCLGDKCRLSAWCCYCALEPSSWLGLIYICTRSCRRASFSFRKYFLLEIWLTDLGERARQFEVQLEKA